MQIFDGKKKATKWFKKWIWEGLGPHLGGVWGGLGPLLDALGRLFAVFWAFKVELFSSMGPRWAPRGLLDRFWVDLGRDLEGFWEDLAGSNYSTLQSFTLDY